MKNRKGFTLIELLAVIIILGILMLVAIPSVTTYINNSRKESYVTTAKQYIRSATNLVNEGTKDFFDPDTTYYIPIKCLPLETGGDSPYGKFDKAYVLVTYNNESFNYYWISRDETGQGIKKATLSDDLKAELIEAGIKPEDIRTNISVEGKMKTLVLDEGTCDVGKADSFSYAVDTSNLVNEVYTDSDPHDDGYTTILPPRIDYSTLTDFPVYCSQDHSITRNFSSTMRNYSFQTLYGYYHYSKSDYTTGVKLLYNFPTFKKNSDGSIHTVKRFIANINEDYMSPEGRIPFSFACVADDPNQHIIDCEVKQKDFVMPLCDTSNYYCFWRDKQTPKSYAYYILDNGDVLEGWRTAEYNGGVNWRYGKVNDYDIILIEVYSVYTERS